MNSLNNRIIELPILAKFAMGMLSILVGVLANFAYEQLKPMEQKNSKVVSKSIIHTPFFPQFLAMTQDIGELKIDYDREITIKGTGAFKIKFVPPVFSGLDISNVKPLKVSLSGTDIEVAPNQVKTFTPEEVINGKAEWEWSFRPKSAGPNKLVVTTENLPYAKWYQPWANRNEGYELPNPMFLDVQVNELSGLSPKIEFYVKAGGGVLAFLLMYPLLISFLHRRLGWGQSG